MVISQIFAQTTIDTLSVTIYPEFSYPGVAIEYTVSYTHLTLPTIVCV